MARCPDALWRPTDKHGYPGNDTHLHQGLVIHSAEGSLAGMFSVLDGSRQASWHLSVAQDGRRYQHVDTGRIAWTNGSQLANEKFWGIECEGRGPLTEPQYQSLVGVVRWLWDAHGLARYERQQTLWEHNEMTRFGAAPTACPSGRIPWTRLIADLEDDMTPEDMRKVQDMITASLRTWIGPRDETMARIDRQQTDHRKDDSKHGGGGTYTDADAVKAVKNKL